MKKLIVCMIFLVVSHIAYASSECSTFYMENGSDEGVMSEDGQYLGYVSPNTDGSWFVWIDKKGSLNEQPTQKSDAIALVCSYSEDL